MIGIPTPYVCRYPSTICALNVAFGVNVRNELVRVTGAPDGPTAAARTV
jgi:hypothetical protein